MALTAEDIKVIAKLLEENNKNLVTKEDLKNLDLKLSTKIDNLETKLVAKIVNVETKLNARIDNLEAKLNARIDDLEARLNVRIDDMNQNSVKYSDISDLFQEFEINIKNIFDDRYVLQTSCNLQHKQSTQI